jgi:hypothetical protein
VPIFRVKNLSVSIGKQEIGNVCHILNSCSPPTWKFCQGYTTFCVNTCNPLSCNGASVVPCAQLSCPIISIDHCLPTHVLPDPTTVIQVTPEIIKMVENPDVLDLLRGQLEEALTVAKARGVEIEERMRPQTLQDVESLETELRAALEELRSMKKKMS